MEVRIATISLAIIAILYTWIRRGKNRGGYLLLATIYFLLVIGFNLTSIGCNQGIIPKLDIGTLNFISQVVRIVGIITVAVYVGIPRRIDGLG